VVADEVGALLRFATVSITKNERSAPNGFNQPNRDVNNGNVWDDDQF